MLKDIFRMLLKNDPKIGEIWVDSDGDPFNPIVVKILDIKDGWVKYYMNPSFPSNSMKISTFKMIYKKKNKYLV